MVIPVHHQLKLHHNCKTVVVWMASSKLLNLSKSPYFSKGNYNNIQSSDCVRSSSEYFILHYLILITFLGGKYYCHHHFIEESVWSPERLNTLSKVIQLLNGVACIYL